MENDAVRMGMRLAAELGVVLPISFYERDVNNQMCIRDRWKRAWSYGFRIIRPIM